MSPRSPRSTKAQMRSSSSGDAQKLGWEKLGGGMGEGTGGGEKGGGSAIPSRLRSLRRPAEGDKGRLGIFMGVT